MPIITPFHLLVKNRATNNVLNFMTSYVKIEASKGGEMNDFREHDRIEKRTASAGFDPPGTW